MTQTANDAAEDPVDGSASDRPNRSAWHQTPQLVIVLVLAVVGAGGWWLTGWHGPARAVAVQAVRDIPAFSRLSAQDVVTGTAVIESAGDLIPTTSAAIGQIVAVPVAKGAMLSNSMLLDAPQVKDDWWIVTLPVTSTVAPAPGEAILLVGVDEAGQSVRVSDQAVALGMADVRLAVAVPPDDGLRAAAYMGGSRRLLAVRVLRH